MRVSRVRTYKPSEINRAELTRKALQVFDASPFDWQLDAAIAILEGRDVVLDVGTGSGKTMCFSLPLLVDETDIALIISPLSALMIDQVGKSPASLPSVAVCAENLSRGKDAMFKVSFQLPSYYYAKYSL